MLIVRLPRRVRLRSDSHIQHNVHPTSMDLVDCLSEIIDCSEMGIYKGGIQRLMVSFPLICGVPSIRQPLKAH